MNEYVLFILVTLISASLLFFVQADSLFLKRCEKDFDEKIECESLAFSILADFQKNAFEKIDFEGDPFLTELLEKYSYFELEISDVSSQKNEITWPKEILNERSLKVSKYPNISNVAHDLEDTKNEALYGWLNSRFALELTATNADLRTDFPFVNDLPILNIYFAEEELLSEILDYYKIDKNLQYDFFQKKDSHKIFSSEEISSLLNVEKNSILLSFFGVKTTFWEVLFKKENIICTAIFCAIPKKTNSDIGEKSDKIAEYQILEMSFEKQ